MKMFVLALFLVIFGIFGRATVMSASLEDDLRNSPEIQRFREALATENIQNLSPQALVSKDHHLHILFLTEFFIPSSKFYHTLWRQVE